MQKFGEHTIALQFSVFHVTIILFLLLFFSGSNSEAQAFLQRDGQIIIRMRGLPFDANAKDVVSRFNACKALYA
jgi:hypothetical protein